MAVAQHLPHGRHQAGDRHLKFHDVRDNLHVQPATDKGSGHLPPKKRLQILLDAQKQVLRHASRPLRRDVTLKLFGRAQAGPSSTRFEWTVGIIGPAAERVGYHSAPLSHRLRGPTVLSGSAPPTDRT